MFCKEGLRVATCAALLIAGLAARSDAAERHILLLHSFDRGILTLDYIAANFRADVEARAGDSIILRQFVVYPSGFGATPEAAIVEYLQAAMSGTPEPDLVITFGGPAATFTRKYHRELFPGRPVLYAAVDERFLRGEPLAANETAIAVSNDIAQQLDNILQLRPETSNVFVVLGSGGLARFWRGELEREFQPYRDRVTFSWSDAMPYKEVLRHAAALPPGSAILFVNIGTDPQGNVYPEERAFADLRATANAPVFGGQSAQLGHGIVGGRLMSIEDIGRTAADTAIKILDGTAPAAITATVQEPGAPVFDWRELQRWGISENRLPAGSTIRYRQPGVWERYRGVIVAATIALVAQTVLIGALLINRSRLRAARVSLSNLSLRLMDAQEQERRRVARELHDDVGQRMAVLTLELGHLRQTLPDSESEARGVVTGLAETVSALASDIQGISHRLHSSKLDVLGLVPAARSLCTEISLQRGVAIEFAHDSVPAQLPDGVALSLFRVLQEALTNAVKYADAKECTVTLRGNGSGVVLEVSDDGRGFDVGEALAGPGLGLVSMQERIKLAGGVVEITSRPGAGTTVRARVPLPAETVAPGVYAQQ